MDEWHLRKLATETDEIAQLHRRSDVTLQLLEYLGCRKILTLLDIIGQVKIEIEILIYRRNHLKLSVARHNQLGLLRIKIGLLACLQCRQGLRIELFIIRKLTYIDRTRQFYTQESAIAGWVGEDIFHVARGDERCHSRKLLHMTAIRRFHLHTRQLDDVFQKSLLHLRRYLIELIQVEEQCLAHCLKHLPFF